MKTVAIIGASSNRNKYGNKALRAFERQGYRVIPINPNERQVEGHATYASVTDVAEPIDMVTVYVPPAVGVRVMDDIARKGIKEVWLNPGADGPEVVARATELASRLREESHCRRTSLGAGRVPESERNDFTAIPREPELGLVRSVEREVRRRSRRVEHAAPKALHAPGARAERDNEQRKDRRQRGAVHH